MYKMYKQVYNVFMEIITATIARKRISDVMNKVKYQNRIFGIGRRNNIEVIIMKYPENLNIKFDNITNINANSKSFDFLKDEPDIYSVNDLKKKYV